MSKIKFSPNPLKAAATAPANPDLAKAVQSPPSTQVVAADAVVVSDTLVGDGPGQPGGPSKVKTAKAKKGATDSGDVKTRTQVNIEFDNDVLELITQAAAKRDVPVAPFIRYNITRLLEKGDW